MRVNVPVNVAVDVGTPSACVPDAGTTADAQRRSLFEAAIVGPLMLWGGAKAGGLVGTALAVLGVVTVVRGAKAYQQAKLAATAVNLPAPPPAG